MSHRVTTKTEIKDKGLAIEALKLAGYSYRDMGSSLYITSGTLNYASINLDTGEVSGDSDYHSKDALESIKQNYGEAKYRKECTLQGITVSRREVLRNGDIKLYCTMG